MPTALREKGYRFYFVMFDLNEPMHIHVDKPPDALLSVPVAIPSLDDVIQFAKALHAAGQPWEGTAFGWPADYTPEVNEEGAFFEEYDEQGAVQTVAAPRWSPAIFCIGINDLWFVSLTWELGAGAEPWVYLEDDYGYHFDEAAQIALAKSRLKATSSASLQPIQA